MYISEHRKAKLHISLETLDNQQRSRMRKTKIRKWEDYYANYDTKYMAEVTHLGLNEHRVLTDRDEEILGNKINNLVSKWDKKWQAYKEKKEKQRLLGDLESQAAYLSKEAKEYLEAVENILKNTLNIDDSVDWEELKDHSGFTGSPPEKPSLSQVTPPDPKSSKYQPVFDFWDKILKKKKQSKIDSCKQIYDNDYQQYLKMQGHLDLEYEKALESYDNAMEAFNQRKRKFCDNQKAANKKVDLMKENYLNKVVGSIEEYSELVLNNSDYPPTFPQSFELEFSPDIKSLVIDYWLPSPEDMPSVKEVKFIKSRQELKEVAISEAQKKRLFDSSIYQITLRSVHELFEADAAQALDMITFNGWVSFINKANGQRESSCIVSLQANKEEFEAINLEYVDPKECFKSLKGVGSSKLYGLSPVKPILQLDKNDSRITSHYDVAHTLNDSMNLAEMEWEDFEHLVRELFSKEFSINGGEVNVTQASRDGGVDAIAFDPDPIRGGKIVIQAKRYSNTVGVSAVRDLFGTLVNEGANKGILVTTANYGPDAYAFAKGKPITLLSGANLLHLLSKHGYSARINLKEAKNKRSQS